MTEIILRFPTGSDEEMAFQTFDGYLAATCIWTQALHNNGDGLLGGLAHSVRERRWAREIPAGSAELQGRASELLRNAWATEVLLNASRNLGSDEVLTFANLWAPVQAYYAVYQSILALAVTVHDRPPKTHATVLKWIASQVSHELTPFVPPWTARVSGMPGAWTFDGFGGVTPDPGISNLASPSIDRAPHLIAKALATTRRDQIDERRAKWLQNLRTKSGKPRKNLPRSVFVANAQKMVPTTLFDLLWRLRTRSNYKEGDYVLSGALGPEDARRFHGSLGEIVASTLLITEVYLSHLVGRDVLVQSLDRVPLPDTLASSSARSRMDLW